MEKIIESLARVPVDTTHHDPANFNVGFNDSGNLVLFDLHYVTAFPRFKDLALRVGASASPFPSSKSADYWIEVYLDYYNRFKKCRMTLDDCKKEVEVIKQAYKLYFDEQCLNEAVRAFNNNDEKLKFGYSSWLVANYKYITNSV